MARMKLRSAKKRDTRTRRNKVVSRDPDRTPPITGNDATAKEATIGNAGDGASMWGADRTEFVSSYEADEYPEPLEPEPGDPRDVQPDHLEKPETRDLKENIEALARRKELQKNQDPHRAVDIEGKPRIEKIEDD